MPRPPDGLVVAYRAKLKSYRDHLGEGLVAAWDDLDAWDGGQVDSFEAATAPLFSGAKALAVATSAAFFALAMRTPPASVSAAEVDVASTAKDAFLAAWHALNTGRPIEEAVGAGRSAASAAGFDFVQSASRRTGDHVARASGLAVKWRRIPGAGACEWCHTVAGQLYRSAESADFGHHRCDCVAVPA